MPKLLLAIFFSTALAHASAAEESNYRSFWQNIHAKFEKVKKHLIQNKNVAAEELQEPIIAESNARPSEMLVEAGRASYRSGLVQMDRHVEVELGDGRKLSCLAAEYDPEAGVLYLHGDAQEKIVFQDAQLKMSCYEARLDIASDLHVDKLETSGDVAMFHKSGVTAHAENAAYRSGNDGYIMLAGDEICQLKSKRGDIIKAKIFCFHPSDKLVTIDHPSGTLSTEPFVTHFEADQLIWDRDNEEYRFTGNVKIRQNQLGTIAVSDRLTINKKKRNLHAEGAIELSFLLSNALKCNGTLDIDHNEHIATIHSPDDFIHFSDSRGKIEAHRATIHYLGENKPLFLSFIAEENVRIVSYATVDDVISETMLHSVITDHAELNIGNQSLTLRADDGKRTLLYDHINHLQVSAPSLVLQRDIHTNKDKIEGLGDVRFSFTEQELQRIKQQLSWIK